MAGVDSLPSWSDTSAAPLSSRASHSLSPSYSSSLFPASVVRGSIRSGMPSMTSPFTAVPGLTSSPDGRETVGLSPALLSPPGFDTLSPQSTEQTLATPPASLESKSALRLHSASALSLAASALPDTWDGEVGFRKFCFPETAASSSSLEFLKPSSHDHRLDSPLGFFDQGKLQTSPPASACPTWSSSSLSEDVNATEDP